MANETKIEISGRFITLSDTTSRVQYFSEYKDLIKPFRNGDIFYFLPSAVQTNSISVINQSKLGGNPNGDGRTDFLYSDTLNPDTGLVFVDADTMEAWINENIGTYIPIGNSGSNPLYISTVGGSGQPNTSEIVFVSQKSDLPTAVAGVITLLANVTYYFTGDIDLIGDRIVTSANTTILGASSENCSITSTGIGTSFPTNYLIETLFTLPIRHITIKDVPLGIGINTSNTGIQPIALDWTGVNFSGTSISLTCGDIDNLIFSKGAVLSGGGFVFEGNVGTIGIDNSIFVGDGTAYNLIELTSSCVVTRRFRTIYTSFVAFGSTVGIDVNVSATIPVDSYILDTCNFSGGGTYLQGIGQFFTDNEPRFVNCKGILNTTSIGNYYMNNNATVTTITTINTPVKVLGTTTANTINQKFTHTDNRLTYVGELQEDFQTTAVASFTGTGNNKKFCLFIAKNGTVITSSEMCATTDGNNRAESISIQTVFELSNADYVEVWIENATDTTDVTVQYLNTIIKEL